MTVKVEYQTIDEIPEQYLEIINEWRSKAEAAVEMENMLHVASCKAVNLLNSSAKVAACEHGREASIILRKALAEYAEHFMSRQITEEEWSTIAKKHQASISKVGDKS